MDEAGGKIDEWGLSPCWISFVIFSNEEPITSP
jgi:hypothetical protein